MAYNNERALRFYLGPFQEPFNEVYNDHIRPAATDFGLFINRADEIFGTRSIMQDIWENLYTASVIIADVTGKNPNVMYEIGMAHSIGKPVIMITQDISDVPFDLRHYRCIAYDFTPRGCKKLRNDLVSTIKSLANVDYSLTIRTKKNSQ